MFNYLKYSSNELITNFTSKVLSDIYLFKVGNIEKSESDDFTFPEKNALIFLMLLQYYKIMVTKF